MSMQPQYPGHGAPGPGPYGPPQGNYPPPGPPPGGPWHGHVPPGGPRPDARRTRLITIAVIVAVVVIGAAGGVWFWTSGGDGGSAGADTPAAQDYEAAVESVGAAEVAWQVPQGVAPKTIGVDDHWVTGEHLVRRLPGRVVAYDMKTGKQAWEVPVGKVDDSRCPSSQEHSKLRVALLVATGDGTSSLCEKLVVVDIGTGKEVVAADLPPVKGGQVRVTDVPVVFGEAVVVPSQAGVRVLDINTGAVRSTPSPDAACQSRSVGLFGDLLLAHAVCGNAGNQLRAFDANLKSVWEWATPKGKDGKPLPVLDVVSADPLVVELGHFGHETQLMRVDPASGRTVPISAYVRGKYMSACDGWSLGYCDRARVAGNKVIVMTPPTQVNPDTKDASPGMRSTEFRNELVAFDLDTGKEAWRTGMVAGRALSLVPVTDGGVVAYQPANPNGSKGLVLSVDPGTGKLAPLMAIGPKAHADDKLNKHVRTFGFGADNHQAVWRDGLFVMFKTTHRAASQGDPDTVAFALPR
ncbi:PQQ-binding-like beta-propeller repeat protein [Kibdelosporangium persicum]|uniref:Pyrrolo-quinoline quinone repeat domain-containing protein n=1 Tax=Kibdelosporangium persicum TaxID=2698649 RepID=A0ABX2F624_9PSEU|nr:PQQ-binding-like beta-propeller repeat protein [Kibdelosporangium persicum]NRN66425.1 hypothetical protein [Kibdelosporangium persicum]